jgi:hypothetical protein
LLGGIPGRLGEVEVRKEGDSNSLVGTWRG